MNCENCGATLVLKTTYDIFGNHGVTFWECPKCGAEIEITNDNQLEVLK